MKLQTALTTVALSLLSMGTVSAGWQPYSPGHSYEDYCTAGGAQVATPHACFEVPLGAIAMISSRSQFTGYLQARGDTAHIAFLLNGQDAVLYIKEYVLRVKFIKTGCVETDISNDGGSLENPTICGDGPWDLPSYLWE
ncbi:conserved hypothetical Ustilaginaceae-specific protein [Sporisorium reilianum SRZ2]|uniref:Mig1 protein n=2 Tax=Sporisorium reilianum TaxID=72558 RepID=A0A2N8UMV4_9BASI|nr:conserved hypothetical Ustilaginaceae-specific protein [Sporisorium reilianum SRZ2]SJX66082.1 uncharacterized protein SRS1_13523 [Sporisorium reilianum f. sp. reilianum]